jgi:hypothetical protein
MNQCVFRIQFSDGRVEEKPFPDGRVRIGREAGDLVLGDPSSSGVHGELFISGGNVTYTDLGSSNGSFDAQNRRLSGPTPLAPGQSVRLGTSVITLLRPASVKPALAGTAAMPQIGSPPPPPPAAPPGAAYVPPPPPPAAALAPAAFAPRSGNESARVDVGSSAYSHPDQAIRHSYPVVIKSASVGEAMGLLMKTLPFLGVRLGISLGLTVAAIVYWALLIGGFIFLSKATPLLGWAWLIALGVVAGGLWRFFVRYVLYMLKAGHIVVLTELITSGQVGNGSEGMFQYAKRVVTARFGEINVLFGLDMLIDGIVRAFNRTLDWIANLLPIPGLDSVMGVVRGVLRASTTYIDETIFSYNLARGDENVFRSSKDGLIYYAQNAKEVLRTGVWVVVLDYVLTFAVWLVMLAPAFVIAYLLPGAAGLAAMVVAALLAGSIRSAVLHPLFLTLVMVKFHTVTQNQPINLEWDQRLSSASRKFDELKGKAEEWVRTPRGRAASSPAQTA